MTDVTQAYAHLAFSVNVVLPALVIAAMIGAAIAFTIATRRLR